MLEKIKSQNSNTQKCRDRELATPIVRVRGWGCKYIYIDKSKIIIHIYFTRPKSYSLASSAAAPFTAPYCCRSRWLYKHQMLAVSAMNEFEQGRGRNIYHLG